MIVLAEAQWLQNQLKTQPRAPSTRVETGASLKYIPLVLGPEQGQSTSRPFYAADHMPPLPPRYTYKHTPVSWQKIKTKQCPIRSGDHSLVRCLPDVMYNNENNHTVYPRWSHKNCMMQVHYVC
jgi:hypothetical protein